MRTDRLDVVIDDLLGSDLELEIALEERDIMEETVSIDEHLYIDSKARCCAKCGFWFDPKVLNDDNECSPCVIGEEF